MAGIDLSEFQKLAPEEKLVILGKLRDELVEKNTKEKDKHKSHIEEIEALMAEIEEEQKTLEEQAQVRLGKREQLEDVVEEKKKKEPEGKRHLEAVLEKEKTPLMEDGDEKARDKIYSTRNYQASGNPYDNLDEKTRGGYKGGKKEGAEKAYVPKHMEDSPWSTKEKEAGKPYNPFEREEEYKNSNRPGSAYKK